MPSESKITRLIMQLTKGTVDKDIEWERAGIFPPSLTRGTDDIIPYLITTEYKGQHIGLMERRHRGYDGENDVHYWASADCLVFLSFDNEIIWEHMENSSALNNLMRVAKEAAAGVDDILDSLLS